MESAAANGIFAYGTAPNVALPTLYELLRFVRIDKNVTTSLFWGI